MNSNQRQSRWGAPPQQQPPPAGGSGGGGGEPPPRDRSQSWTERQRGDRRGYDTTDVPAADPGRFSDEPRGRWGDSAGREPCKFFASGTCRNGDHCRFSHQQGPSSGRGARYEEERIYENERHLGGGMRGEEDERWRCTECGVFNDPRDERCHRCRRSWRSSMDGQDGRGYQNSGRGRRDSDEDGHYGPPSRGTRRSRDSDDDYDNREHRSSRKKPREDDDAPKKREWPPHFESSGASFLFDARSGMFYEPSSDFFYDPKNKLYYSNERRQYFRYDAGKNPHPFQPIGEESEAATAQQGQGGGGQGIITPKVVTAAEEATVELAPGLNSTEAKPEKSESKPKIAISLKSAIPQKDSGTKSLNELAAMERTKLAKQPKRKESTLSAPGEDGNATPGSKSQSHKKHAKDMDKWSDRVKEIRGEDASDAATKASKKVKTTASGQPICVLCRRKFANLEKLQQHEKLSALHKENLAKKAATDAEAAAKQKQMQKSDTQYRDRTKERRQMYGTHVAPDSSSQAEALLAHSLGTSSEPKQAQTIRPEETLNDTNVGNKLLQKMGWKGALGRDAKAMGNDGEGGSVVKKKDDVASNLKSDWERIESLAQGGGGRRR